MKLSEHHKKMLIEESGIAEEVIETRGYRTVDKKVELETLGFSKAQRNVPGVLIPAYAPTGNIATYQYRPDEPRIKDGRPVKYETPSGTQMVLDVHPFAREMLGAPSVPLLITEGTKKGDALVSRGLCAVVRFALDDFGTGYSSLSYLKRLPVRLLKIDRSFVERLGKDPEDEILLSGVIGIATGLGMHVLAEGVETAEQLAHLKSLGCELAQGNYFSGPLSIEAVGALLDRVKQAPGSERS